MMSKEDAVDHLKLKAALAFVKGLMAEPPNGQILKEIGALNRALQTAIGKLPYNGALPFNPESEERPPLGTYVERFIAPLFWRPSHLEPYMNRGPDEQSQKLLQEFAKATDEGISGISSSALLEEKIGVHEMALGHRVKHLNSIFCRPVGVKIVKTVDGIYRMDWDNKQLIMADEAADALSIFEHVNGHWGLLETVLQEDLKSRALYENQILLIKRMVLRYARTADECRSITLEEMAQDLSTEETPLTRETIKAQPFGDSSILFQKLFARLGLIFRFNVQTARSGMMRSYFVVRALKARTELEHMQAIPSNLKSPRPGEMRLFCQNLLQYDQLRLCFPKGELEILLKLAERYDQYPAPGQQNQREIMSADFPENPWAYNQLARFYEHFPEGLPIQVRRCILEKGQGTRYSLGSATK